MVNINRTVEFMVFLIPQSTKISSNAFRAKEGINVDKHVRLIVLYSSLLSPPRADTRVAILISCRVDRADEGDSPGV